jgi:putative DNA primase/helicase
LTTNSLDKPVAIGLKASNIPAELKTLKQFTCWSYTWRNSRWIKLPVQPNDEVAKSNDPTTWDTWEACLESYQYYEDTLDGIMIALSSSDPYFGIDLDHCRLDEINEPWVNEIIGRFGSYTEKSPSGTGIRILGRGKLPAGGHNDKKSGVEVYDSSRFLTITGNRIGNTPIMECQEQLNVLVKKYWPQDFEAPSPQKKHPIDVNQSHQFSDDEIIGLMANAANSPKIMALLEGDFSGYASQSEADLALVNCIKFYSQDGAQIDRLFRKSGLMREKWDEKHGSQTYGDKTIGKALASLGDTYKGKAKAITEPAGVSPIRDIPIIPAAHQKPFRPALVAQAIKEAGYRFAMGDGRLYMYQGGVYIPANGPLQTLLIRVFGDDWQPRQVEAVQIFLEHDSKDLWDIHHQPTASM